MENIAVERKWPYNAYIIFLVGLILSFVVEVSQHELGDGIESTLEHHGWLRIVIVPLTYVYVATNTVIKVSLWLGGWHILDEWSMVMLGKEEAWSASWITLYLSAMWLAVLITIYLRSSISLIACPLGVASDCSKDMYNAPSLYRRTLTNSTYGLFLCDITMSTIVSCLIVIAWWSTWSLVDYIEKHQGLMAGFDSFVSTGQEKSVLWGSIIVGYILCTSAYLLQVGQY